MANMLYNGVELPDIESVWTGDVKETHPYALIIRGVASGDYYLEVASGSFSAYRSGIEFVRTIKTGFFQFKYDVDGKKWGGGTYYSSGYSVATEYFEVVWTSSDIWHENDGVVYFTASDPVPVTPPLPDLTPAEFLSWFSLGQAVRRGVVKEATMYSYNGVVLPDIESVWTDKVTYPYAVLSIHSEEFAYLILSENPVYYETYKPNALITNRYFVVKENATVMVYNFNSANGDNWEHEETKNIDVAESGFVRNHLGASIWANHDLYTSDGSLYVSASDPIPVYE